MIFFSVESRISVGEDSSTTLYLKVKGKFSVDCLSS